jgi:hypothetical protein
MISFAHQIIIDTQGAHTILQLKWQASKEDRYLNKLNYCSFFMPIEHEIF